MTKSIFISVALALTAHAVTLQAQTDQNQEKAKVYFTSEISPESLVKIYQALGKEATGRVAVKISTGESAQSNHLSPELIGALVKNVNGTLVECNTAYQGNCFVYDLIDISDATSISDVQTNAVSKYNVYDLNGTKVINNADSLDSLSPGVYIINGTKTIVSGK